MTKRYFRHKSAFLWILNLISGHFTPGESRACYCCCAHARAHVKGCCGSWNSFLWVRLNVSSGLFILLGGTNCNWPSFSLLLGTMFPSVIFFSRARARYYGRFTLVALYPFYEFCAHYPALKSTIFFCFQPLLNNSRGIDFGN